MNTPNAPNTPAPTQIRCPICLDMIEPDLDTLYERDEHGSEKHLDVGAITDPVKLSARRRNALVLCSNPSNDTPRHYLPFDYVRYRTPIVIGLIGGKDTGKSTLLAMMINEIDKNRLRDYGFRATPLMPDRHEAFRKINLEALTTRRQTLLSTDPAPDGVDFADGVLLVRGDLRQPVVFFDVGGETFKGDYKFTKFIQAFTALIFVVDPRLVTSRDVLGDPSFRIVSDKIEADSGNREEYLDKPAAIVLAKADTLRFEPAIARWLAHQNETGAVDPRQIRAESRDIFAFLYQYNAEWCLHPFDLFKKCTLHAVSATGSNAPVITREYIRDLRPRRVLEPLIAILAMTGVISGQDAEQVGR